ncbi:SDR family NAD(P)-dependent oxidoreductase [Glutamicibacter endophyticus]|uniref:SDR family NAD(P)-dependent oxidoreductase n=1 Tax=Glutamicibacter endophyticus TaxID=1522174 RepID=UPI003AEF47CB
MSEPSNDSPLVLIAGATSPSGVASGRALAQSGARVLAVGSNAERLNERLDFATGRYVCDLADPEAVAQLAEQIHREHGPIDVLLHLVGGWRGGKGLAGQDDADFAFLTRQVLGTLRNTTKAFHEDLVASSAGRLAIISAEAVQNPTPSNANYGSVKAAAEYWLNAVARLFSKQAPQSAAITWVVKALTDKTSDAPAGFTHADAVGAAAVELLGADAASINGARVHLPTL